MPTISERTTRRKAAALSVVIPAYNEASRLPFFLRAVREYLDSTFADCYEVIVVDDGSQDETTQYLESATADWPQLCFLRHIENLGKGAAVKSGMACATGELRLFADADGATPIEEVYLLRQAISQGADVAAGSRHLPARCERPRRSKLRGFFARAFAALVRSGLNLPVMDTQCGFKLFRHEAAERLFGELTERGFAFDLDLLALAHFHGYRIAEVPVLWREVPGSKVRIVRDSWRMLKSLVAIRRRMRRLNALSDEPAAVRPAAQREVAAR